MKYSIATNWDKNPIIFFQQLNKEKKEQIFEVFGALAFSVFGSARSIPRVRNISISEAERKINNIKNKGLEFNYLLNSSIHPDLRKKEAFQEAKKYLEWIKKLEPNIITVGNQKTLEFICENFPDTKINISIVMAVKSPEKAERLFQNYEQIKRITLHQTINRDLSRLQKHIKIAHKYGVEVELLANEICIYDCPRMKEHYEYLGKISQSGIKTHNQFETWCEKIRLNDPLEFLNSCWIMPEDVGIYEQLGVDILKIAGRGETSSYLKKVVSAYLNRNSPKNIMELFYPNWWPDNKIPFLDKSKLKSFLNYLWSNELRKLTRISSKYNIEYKKQDQK